MRCRRWAEAGHAVARGQMLRDSMQFDVLWPPEPRVLGCKGWAFIQACGVPMFLPKGSAQSRVSDFVGAGGKFTEEGQAETVPGCTCGFLIVGP